MPPTLPFQNDPYAAIFKMNECPPWFDEDTTGPQGAFPLLFICFTCYFFLLLNQDTPLVINVVPFSSFSFLEKIFY